jgi:glutathione S-transferase
LLQPLALVCFDPDCGAQAETVDVGAQKLTRCCIARRRAPERQHLLPGAVAEGEAVGDGRRVQRPQRARLLAVGIPRGQVSRAFVAAERFSIADITAVVAVDFARVV